VCAAIYTDVAQVDHLFSMNFHDSIHLEDQILYLARVLEALRTTMDGLKAHYAALGAQQASPYDSAIHLPSPVSANEPHAPLAPELKLRFLYKLSRRTGVSVDPLDEDDWIANTRHAVFVALGGGQESIPQDGAVIVKFARRYNAAAHQMLARLGLAPKLYHHCSVRGGLTMVIMEKVEGKMASGLASRGQPLPRSVLDGVQLAIQTLHQANIVFGDLRLSNIMVCQDDNSQARAILVDFDWAAIAGEGRYPASLAPFSVWAPTVHPHGLMQKAHDIHMLEVLEGLCSKIAEN